MEQVTEYKVKNTEIQETIKLFNKLRSSFLGEELKKLSILKCFYFEVF